VKTPSSHAKHVGSNVPCGCWAGEPVNTIECSHCGATYILADVMEFSSFTCYDCCRTVYTHSARSMPKTYKPQPAYPKVGQVAVVTMKGAHGHTSESVYGTVVAVGDSEVVVRLDTGETITAEAKALTLSYVIKSNT
jgi:hypothetical protein